MSTRRLPISRDPLALAAALAAGAGLLGADAWGPEGNPGLALLAAALWLVWRPRDRALIFAVAAGALLAPPATPELQARGRVCLEVEVLNARWQSDDDRGRLVRSVRDRHGRRLPAVEFWLVESAEAAPRKVGENLRVQGLWESGRRPRNPGEFTHRRARLRATSTGIQKLPPSASAKWRPTFLAQLRQQGIDTLRSNLPARSAGLGCALLFGERSSLDPEWSRRLRDTGTAHLFALSGLHVALVAGLLDRLLGALHCRSVALRIVALWAYAFLSGAAPPVLRAATAFSLWMLFRSRNRELSIRGPWAWALIGILLAGGANAPASLCLSFAAVAGISAGASLRPRPSPRRSRSGQPHQALAVRLLWVGVCATLATAPFCAHFFGTVSLWSPLSTLLLAPFVLPWMLMAAAALGLSAVSPEAMQILSLCFEASATAASWVASGLERLPGTPLEVPRPSRWLLAVHSIGLWLALSDRWRRGLALSVLGAACWTLASPPSPGLCLIDVGHGQCLIARSESSVDLVDTGGRLDAAQIATTLKALGVPSLRNVFISHLDADHCRALGAVVESWPPDRVLLSSAQRREWTETRDSGVSALRDAVHRMGVPVRFLTRGQQVDEWTVEWPPANRRFERRNEASLVLRRDYGGRSLLITGDLEGYPLIECARLLKPAWCLVLPHHGNEEPAVDFLLDAVRPAIALASRGGPLPKPTADALNLRGIRTVCTSSQGAIHLPSPAGKLLVPQWGPRPPGRRLLDRLLFRQELRPSPQEGRRTMMRKETKRADLE